MDKKYSVPLRYKHTSSASSPGKQLGHYLNQTFRLSEVINRPLISIVTHGEIWAMAQRNGWGDKKRDAVQEMLGRSGNA